MWRRWALSGFVLAVQCAGSPRPASERQAAAQPVAPSRASPTATPSAAGPSVPDAGGATESDASVPLVDLLAFQRVLDSPVHSLALGEPPRVAAIGADVWLDGGKGLAPIARPPRATTNVDVFFGRDNAPRLLGFERGANGIESVYFRWRSGAWQRAASEIGKLGGASGALFGVIGDADPEVVCKTGESCIVKRRSGWTTLPAPPGTPKILLCGKTPWAFEGDRIFRLEKERFRAFGDPVSFARADGMWATSDDEIWVSEREANALHRFRENKWTRETSPISRPRAFWASDPANVWLVGEGGVAHYDGHSWSRVKGPTGALEIVLGRAPSDVWVAGASGVWRGSR